MTDSNASPSSTTADAPRTLHAGVTRRGLALGFDLVALTTCIFLSALLLIVLFGPVVTLDPLTGDAADRIQVAGARGAVESALMLVLGAAYFAVPWRLAQATPGQMLLSLRVVDASTKQALPWSRSFGRWAALGGPFWSAPAIAPYFPVVSTFLTILTWGWFVVLFASTVRDPGNVGLHDRLTSSAVVSR